MNAGRRRSLATAALFLAFGLLMAFVLIPLGVVVPGSVRVAALSPDYWPRIIAWGTILTAVFLLAETLLSPNRPDEAEEWEDAQFALGALPATLRTAGLIVALFAYHASLDRLGLVVASMILLPGMILLFGERRIWLAVALGVAVPTVLYLFFRHVANVPIPLGMFGD